MRKYPDGKVNTPILTTSDAYKASEGYRQGDEVVTRGVSADDGGNALQFRVRP